MGLFEAVEFSKVIISGAVTLYAYFFLRRTENYIERKPWHYLYIAALLLFMVEMVAALQLFRPNQYASPFFSDLKNFLEFIFLGCLLFSFISQHHLLLKRKIIVISEALPKTEAVLAWEEHLDALKEEHSRSHRERKEVRAEERFERSLPHPPEDPQDEEMRALRAKGVGLAAKVENILAQYGDRIDPAKAAVLRGQVDALKEALANPQTSGDDLRRQISLVLSKE